MTIELFQTVMGKQFYDRTMPSIARSLDRLANMLERRDQMVSPMVDVDEIVERTTSFLKAHGVKVESSSTAPGEKNMMIGFIIKRGE